MTTPTEQILREALQHIKGAALDITVSRNAIASAAEEALAATAATAAPSPAAQPEGWQCDLIQLLISIRPQYGAIGSRDCDVTRQQQQIDAAIAILNAAPPALPAAMMEEPIQEPEYNQPIKLSEADAMVLLPCPHCGSNDVELCGMANPNGYTLVKCFGCGARTQEWDRFDKSLGHWNRRAPIPSSGNVSRHAC